MKSVENNILLKSISTSADERGKVSAVEATLIYHGVKHGSGRPDLLKSQESFRNLNIFLIFF